MSNEGFGTPTSSLRIGDNPAREKRGYSRSSCRVGARRTGVGRATALGLTRQRAILIVGQEAEGLTNSSRAGELTRGGRSSGGPRLPSVSRILPPDLVEQGRIGSEGVQEIR
jgi:hypothetical protein